MKKREGFRGQEAIHLPKKVIHQCGENALTSSLFTNYMGYYPKAEFHYRQRRSGTPEYIFILCVDGKGGVTIENKSYDIKPLEYMILPSLVPHHYWADEDNPWTIYWFHLFGTSMPAISEILYKRMQNGSNYVVIAEELIETFRNIYSRLQMGYSIDNLNYSSMSLQFFFRTILYPQNLKQNKDNVPVNKAIYLMQKSLANNLSLNEIAASANLSPQHFCGLFKRTTGYSPIEYFNHLKIQKACQLLQFTSHRINEVANMVGFLDQYYFSRLFNKMMGTSPKYYRTRKSLNEA